MAEQEVVGHPRLRILYVVGVLIAATFLGVTLILVETDELPSLSSSSSPSTSSSTSTTNPSTGLRLDLRLFSNSTGNIYVFEDEYNTLNDFNNVTAANAWASPPSDLNDVCGTNAEAYAVYQGDYGSGNLTQATPLQMGLRGPAGSCSSESMGLYTFRPQSDVFTPSGHQGGSVSPAQVNSTQSVNLQGYWTTSAQTSLNSTLYQGNTFVFFPSGTYTVAAFDQWGDVAILHFDIQAQTPSQGSSFLSKL